jgi:hypothetical protein
MFEKIGGAARKRPEPKRSLSIVNESASRPIDRFAARRDVAVMTAALFVVLDRRRLVLIVVMRIFILLIRTLIGRPWCLGRIAHKPVPPAASLDEWPSRKEQITCRNYTNFSL